jgi:hypothetical protein
MNTGRYIPKIVGFDVITYAELIENDPNRKDCIPDCETDSESSDSEKGS